MTEKAEDYSAFVQPIPDELMARIDAAVKEQLVAEANVAAAEAALTVAQAALLDVSQHRLPAMLEEAGLQELKKPNGLVVKLQEAVHCSLLKDAQASGLEFLREVGDAGLIRRMVGVSFGAGMDENAANLFSSLREQGLPVEDKATVNHQSLSAWARGRLREGLPVPADRFSVHRQKATKILLPKSR